MTSNFFPLSISGESIKAHSEWNTLSRPLSCFYIDEIIQKVVQAYQTIRSYYLKNRLLDMKQNGLVHRGSLKTIQPHNQNPFPKRL